VYNEINFHGSIHDWYFSFTVNGIFTERINAASTCQWQNKTNAKLSLLKRVTVLKRIYINAEISAGSLKKKKGRHSYRVSALIKERNVKTNGSEVISIVRLLLYAVRNPRQHFFAKEKAAHPKADGLSLHSLKLTAAIRHSTDAHQVDFDCQRIDGFIQGINSHCGNRNEQYDGGFDNFHLSGHFLFMRLGGNGIIKEIALLCQQNLQTSIELLHVGAFLGCSEYTRIHFGIHRLQRVDDGEQDRIRDSHDLHLIIQSFSL
jgi:hypothetical protein